MAFIGNKEIFINDGGFVVGEYVLNLLDGQVALRCDISERSTVIKGNSVLVRRPGRLKIVPPSTCGMLHGRI